MNNKKNRRIAMLVAILMLTMVFSSTGFAAWMGTTLNAQYRNISIFVNNQYKQASDVNGKVIEPFIVDGTTYVPLRGVAQMLGYEVGFNPQTYRIDITGNVAGNTAALEYQLLVKDARIAELEAQLAEKETTGIDGLEEELNDEYTQIDRLVDISEIELRESKSYLEVGIYVYLRTTSDIEDWEEVLDDGEVKNFIEDIVDYIVDNYDEYDYEDIEGFIEDEYDSQELVTFTTNSRGVVSLDGKTSSSNWTLSDLEDELYDEFNGYYGIEDFRVFGTTSNIDIDVLVDYDDWRALSSSNKSAAKNEIIDFIEDAFPDSNIDGLVISNDSYGDELDSFYN